MIVAIDGKRFDTTKAQDNWPLSHFDGHNLHEGHLYLSSQGTWYLETPSQWANGRRWEIIDPAVVIERYRQYFSQDEIAEIIQLAELDTE